MRVAKVYGGLEAPKQVLHGFGLIGLSCCSPLHSHPQAACGPQIPAASLAQPRLLCAADDAPAEDAAAAQTLAPRV